MTNKLLFAGILFGTVQICSASEMNNFMELSLEQLTQVEITGSTLTTENIKTVPSAVTSFTHSQIKRMGLDTLDELMNLVPGFQSYRSTITAQQFPVSSRGRRIGRTSSEILILIDGQRLDEPRTSGSSVMLSKYSLTNIERVEFIRGPGAAVYGSNAMMGVVNVITRSGENEAFVGYGSLNRKQAYVLSSGSLRDIQVDFFGQLQADDGDTFNVQDSFSANRIDTDDAQKSADLNLKLRWKKTQLNIQHNQIESDNFYVVNNISNNFNEYSGAFSAISLKQSFDWNSVSSYLWLSYHQSKVDLSGQLTPPGALFDISNFVSNDPLFFKNQLDDNNETRIQWHNDWEIDQQNELLFGIEYRYIKSNLSLIANNFDIAELVNGSIPITYYGTLEPTTPVQTPSTRNIIGIYSQYQHQLDENTELTLGLRFDSFSNIDTNISPRLGLVHALNKSHTIKLLYAEAFRAPSENELNLINNPVTLGNPNLMPETVRSWDAIWVAQWPSTNTSLGYFENHFDDAIVLVPTGTGPASQFQNINQKPSRGIEFEISHELDEHWLLSATYTQIIQNSEASFREAEQLASFMLNYQKLKWNANLIASYSGERQMPINNTDTLITLDAYWQLFAKVSYIIAKDFQAYLQAKNLLNNNYLTPAANSSLTEGVPNRGPEILLGLKWEY